ncbi:hypothetical protein J6590_006005 [Homalodisca vitripennis]|nr:hypothetical protein J6590_006005 [Homalodisca vitripennis]
MRSELKVKSSSLTQTERMVQQSPAPGQWMQAGYIHQSPVWRHPLAVAARNVKSFAKLNESPTDDVREPTDALYES